MTNSAAPRLDPQLAAWLDANDQRLHDQLFEFLRIPSVSARSEHTGDVRRAAQWLHERLAKIGFTTETLETPGHPVVLAERVGQHQHGTVVRTVHAVVTRRAREAQQGHRS